MTPEAQVVDTRFFRSVIPTVGALAYADAQKRIDTKLPEDVITEGCIGLMNMARKLRAQRFAKGAITLDSAAQKFKLDPDTKMPKECKPYPLYDANHLVEEFMLLANITVAKRILQQFPKMAMLRRHPTPTPVMLEPLVQAAKLRGCTIKIENSKQLASSLDTVALEKDKKFAQLLRMRAIKCMSQAVYFSSGEHEPKEYWHYGLATEIYTHFTSPIRRSTRTSRR